MNNVCVKGLFDFILPKFMVKCGNFNNPGMLPISQESKEEEKVVKKEIENRQLFEKPKSVHKGKCAAYTETRLTFTNYRNSLQI